MKKLSFFDIQSQLAMPFLESNRDFLKAIFNNLELYFNLKKNSNQRFVDLGSGNGRVVFYIALNYNIQSVGYEINPSLIKEAKEIKKKIKKEKRFSRNTFRKIILKNKDFFNEDLSEFDFIYIYSLPTMQKFLNHLFKTLKESAIVISYKYELTNLTNLLNFSHFLDLKDENIKVNFYRKK